MQFSGAYSASQSDSKAPVPPVGPSYFSNGPRWCGVGLERQPLRAHTAPWSHVWNTCNNYTRVDWALFFFLRWQYKGWALLSVYVTLSGLWPFSLVLTFGVIPVKSTVLQQRCLSSGGHVLPFSVLRSLFTTLHPLQLVELQLCTSQDQRLLLLAKSICVATESVPNLLPPCSPPPHPWTRQS